MSCLCCARALFVYFFYFFLPKGREIGVVFFFLGGVLFCGREEDFRETGVSVFAGAVFFFCSSSAERDGLFVSRLFSFFAGMWLDGFGLVLFELRPGCAPILPTFVIEETDKNRRGTLMFMRTFWIILYLYKYVQSVLDK